MKEIKIRLDDESAEAISGMAIIRRTTVPELVSFAVKYGVSAFLDEKIQDSMNSAIDDTYDVSEIFKGITAEEIAEQRINLQPTNHRMMKSADPIAELSDYLIADDLTDSEYHVSYMMPDVMIHQAEELGAVKMLQDN